MKIKYKIQNMVNILTCGLYSRVKNSSKLFINDVLDDDSGDKLKKYAFLLIMAIFLLFSINIIGTVLGLGGARFVWRFYWRGGESNTYILNIYLFD